MTRYYVRKGVHYGTADEMIDYIDDLEAKLAKAVEFVECAINYAKTCGARFPVDHARTTIAELKGEKDE